MIEKLSNNKKIENKTKKDFKLYSKKAKTELGTLWDMLDNIQPNHEMHVPEFPYGDKVPKPYGWHNK